MKNSNILDSNFLTYIAGILVPTTQITISSSFNAIPTATIHMPPYSQLYGIGRKDRLPVHIFTKEFRVEGEYVLIFEGTVKDFSYSSSMFSREISVNAVGILSFLDQVNVRFLSSVEATAQANVPGAQDSALQQYIPAEYFPMSLFAYGLGEASSENMIRFPSEYLDNVINFVAKGGGAEAKKQMNDSALAKFYAEYCDDIALVARYAHLPYFDEPSIVWGDGQPSVFPLVSGLQTNAIFDTFSRILSNQGDTSLLNLLNYLVNQMEYECAFFSCPTFSATKGSISGVKYTYNDRVMVSMALKPVFFDALPPACNIIFKSQNISIQTIEDVSTVPTRVRTRDLHSVFARHAGGSDSVIKEFGTIDYYPSKYFMQNGDVGTPSDGTNIFASELLDTEVNTGPKVYETHAPVWMSYVGPKAVGENPKVFKEKLLKRLLMHKQFEYRTLSVTTGFNYYFTPGFPGVVFDSQDSDFVFCGHVYTVNHSISKQGVQTVVEMGFVRLLEDAIANPISNPIEGVDTVSKDSDYMTAVTRRILGCDTLSLETVNELRNDEAQTNPLDAYSMQYRSIVTMEQYCSMLGLEIINGIIGDNEQVPIELVGKFTQDRFKLDPESVPKFSFDDGNLGCDYSDIVSILRVISEKEFGKPVYEGGAFVDHTSQSSTNTVSKSEAGNFVNNFVASAVNSIAKNIL